MTRYVLDASAGVDLMLNTEAGRRLQLDQGAEWWVPEHYFVEAASTIRRAELTSAISTEQAVAALRSLRGAPLRSVSVRSWTMPGRAAFI